MNFRIGFYLIVAQCYERQGLRVNFSNSASYLTKFTRGPFLFHKTINCIKVEFNPYSPSHTVLASLICADLNFWKSLGGWRWNVPDFPSQQLSPGLAPTYIDLTLTYRQLTPTYNFSPINPTYANLTTTYQELHVRSIWKTHLVLLVLHVSF